MFKPFIKLSLCLCSFVVMLSVVSCGDDEPEVDSDIISKEEVQLALWNSDFKPIHQSESMLEDGSCDFSFAVEPSNKSALTIKGHKVNISKVEFYFDEGFLSVSDVSPYLATCTISDFDVTHTLTARIYGSTSPENETFITLTVQNFEPGNYEVTKEEIQAALTNAEYIFRDALWRDSETGVLIRELSFDTNTSKLKVKGIQIKLTKAEFLVDGVLIETQYSTYEHNSSFVFSYYPDINSEKDNYDISIRLYGATNFENETYITFPRNQ